MTPDDLREILRRLRQQREQGGEEFPDDSEPDGRTRYQVRKNHFSLGPDGARPLFSELETHELGEDGGVMQSRVIHMELDDGTPIVDERQLKKIGKCETLVTRNGEVRPCGMESLVEICSRCGRKCCRFHRVRLNRNEYPAELSEMMEQLPESVLEQLVAGRFVCHNCIEQAQEQIEKVDRREKRAQLWAKVRRFLTAIFRRRY